MTLNLKKTLEILQNDGPLSHVISNYEKREEQQAMLQTVVEAYNENKIALIEAGTGTGKSMAYLIPAILWASETSERTVISTNTIALQEQIINKDIPLTLKALNTTTKAVLVKGMRNYLCLRKLEDAHFEKRSLPDKEAEDLSRIEDWAEYTRDGTLSSLSFVPSYTTWDRVSAESDTCNRKECPYASKCHFLKARKQAEDAQILVVNHNLLFADLAYRQENNDGLIPDYTRVVLDEAHHVEDVATEFFSSKISHLQLFRTLVRLGGEKNGKLAVFAYKIRENLKKGPTPELKRILDQLEIDFLAHKLTLQNKITDTFQVFGDFIQLLDREKGDKLRILPEQLLHPKWINEVLPQTKELIELIRKYTQSIRGLESDFKNLKEEKLYEMTEGVRFDMNALGIRLEAAAEVLETFTAESLPKSQVKWIESQTLKTMVNIHLIIADLEIAPKLAESLFKPIQTHILCSATLTTNNTFTYMRKRLGLEPKFLLKKPITEDIYPSPFDYSKQALLAIPKDMPPPTHPQFLDAVCNCTLDALLASRGNAFVLFTSYSMLQTCYEKMIDKLTENRFLVLRQGENSRQTLLEKFKKTDGSILFGTDTFWEGVDVVGEALRCVIIVKLPFKVPSEPIIQARTEAITKEGGNAFLEYSVPNAIVKFKQGFGRLIRNRKDRGCILCLDSRLLSKDYGKLFLSSLPPCKQLITTQSSLKQPLIDFYKTTYHLTL